MKTNKVVVDTSIAIKWVLNEPDSSTAFALLSTWTRQGMVILAPVLLAYETTNVLHHRIRSGKISFEDAEQGLKEVIFAVFVFDFEEEPDFSIRAVKLAGQFGLPAAYDAHYLALAEREDCELWTADMRMWNATKGKLPWVRWLGDYSAP